SPPFTLSPFPYTTLFRSYWLPDKEKDFHPEPSSPLTCGTISPAEPDPPADLAPPPASIARDAVPPNPAARAARLEKSPQMAAWRSEEHTSELQSRVDLVC